MSTVVQLNDVFAVRLGFRDANGHMAFNQLHYRVSAINVAPPGIYAGETVTEVAPALNDQILLNVVPVWALLASQNVGCVEVMSQSIYPEPKSRQYTSTPAIPFDGAINDDALPLQDTPTLVKRTIFGTRWGVGRVFVVGLPESAQALGNLNPAHETLVQDFGDVLDDDQTVLLGGVQFVFKPILFGAPPAVGQPPRMNDLISVALSGPSLKTQRRRRPGKGI